MKKNIIAVIGIMLIIASCVKMPKRDVPDTPDPSKLEIPSNFDWKTVKELDITVTVQAIDENSRDRVHIIRIYNSPLINSSSLISTGGATPNNPYASKLTIATPTQALYVHETKPNGVVKVTTVNVSSAKLNISLSSAPQALNTTKSSSAFGQNTAFTSPSIPLPANYDVIVNNNNALQLLGFTAGQSSAFGNTHKSYYIPEGFTRTAEINFSNWSNHSILYVKGTLNMTGIIGLNRSSIVVLDGGKVTAGGVGVSYIAGITVPIVYVQPGGTLTSTSDISLTNESNSVNKGVITFVGAGRKLNMSVSSKFYNEGTINQSGTAELYISNNCQFFNSGTVEMKSMDLTVNSTILNTASGKIEVDEWYQTNGTVLNNYGEVVANVKFSNSGGGTVNNYCRIAALETDFQAMTANLESGSLWNSINFKANNSTINMFGGSMFQTSNITALWALNVLSSSKSYSLFKCTGDVISFISANTQFNGKIEFVHEKLTEGSGTNGRLLYQNFFTNGALLNKVQENNIQGTACNASLGQIDPIDPGGEDPPVTFADWFPSESGWATYAFEDQWPQKGDYDLNDLVVQFRVTFVKNVSNQITDLHIDYSIVAYGAIKGISAAVQLDNIAASLVESVTGQTLGSGSVFVTAANGVESGVSTAVVPLFNNAHNIESFTGFLNTVPGSYTPTSNRKIMVKFTSPVSSSQLSMSSFNFFIAVNERGREIHLPGFSPTSKFDIALKSGATLHPTDNFKASDGMMWGLMFPVVFDYPSETNSIIDAYTHFAAWATSGGSQYPDWYSNTAGYRNNALIY